MIQQASPGPRIEIDLNADGANIRQFRPAVLSQLAGMPIGQALRLVPNLLPICGAAQSIAAARAVEAAAGGAPDKTLEAEREQLLAREQALSGGWRLAVDWPDLLDEPRQMAWLKQLRSSQNPEETAAILLSALPGIGEIRTLNDLQDWTGSAHCCAARALSGTLEGPTTSGTHLLKGEGLDQLARAALGQQAFDTRRPVAASVEVGPLAMQRHRLIEQLQESSIKGPTAQRFAALVLDLIQIARLQTAAAEDRKRAWNEKPGTGVGMAHTARGPVYHRVELGEDDAVIQWRSLAPTDWHFATNGPIVAALSGSRNIALARQLVASFDPCVPCHCSSGETGVKHA